MPRDQKPRLEDGIRKILLWLLIGTSGWLVAWKLLDLIRWLVKRIWG